MEEILSKIQEALESETFAKAVNRRMLNMLFSYTKVLRNPNAPPEYKKQAEENIYAILHNFEPSRRAPPLKQSKIPSLTRPREGQEPETELGTSSPSVPSPSPSSPAPTPPPAAASAPIKPEPSLQKPQTVRRKKSLKPAEPLSTPAPSVPSAPTVTSADHDIPFPEDFHVHHGVDPEAFKHAWNSMTPEQKRTTLDWHREKLSTTKKVVNKSIEKLSQLLKALREKV